MNRNHLIGAAAVTVAALIAARSWTVVHAQVAPAASEPAPATPAVPAFPKGAPYQIQEGTNRFMPRASARLILLAANSGFGGLPSRSLACPLWAVCPSKPTRPTPCQPMSARGTEEMIDWTRQMVGLLEQG